MRSSVSVMVAPSLSFSLAKMNAVSEMANEFSTSWLTMTSVFHSCNVAIRPNSSITLSIMSASSPEKGSSSKIKRLPVSTC